MEIKEELSYEGCNFIRIRLIYSLLSGRPVNITGIRSYQEDPGIKDFEMKLLTLLDKVTNGTRIEINGTGTQISFKPGMILGGSLSFDCGTSRCISYYLEPLLLLGPFCKSPLRVKLKGVTNAPGELSVDAVSATWLPLYRKFVSKSDDLEIKIVSRGLKPDGGGSVLFSASIVKDLRPVQFDKSSKVCKIRGMAYVCKVPSSLAFRMINSAKHALRGFISDVYITLDQRKGISTGNSPGFGIIITAETTDGVVFHGESMSDLGCKEENSLIPEDIGTLAANNLLTQIYMGGCLDSSCQVLASTLMTLGNKDVSKLLFGPLSNYCVHSLRHLKDFFSIVFKIDDCQMVEEERIKSSNKKALLTSMGIGYSNLNKLLL